MAKPRIGSVALVGAGPGDPGLITVRGLALVRAADVIVHDRLIPTAVLSAARSDAEIIDVGKRRGDASSQSAITRLIVSRARAGAAVVRLKGGDPFTFARGGEEAAALARASIPFEIVPGVSSVLAAPAAAGIPVTLRGVSSSVAITTGHEGLDPTHAESIVLAETIVVVMVVERLAEVVGALLGAGRARSTPAALVQDATLPTQRTVVSTLGAIVRAASRVRAPAVLVVGEVVRARDVLGAGSMRALSGRRVLVTRPSGQAAELSEMLLARGAQVIEAPVIRIEPARSRASLATAITRTERGRYDWIVFTSANGVRSFGGALRDAGLDARALAGTQVAVVGPGTRRALEASGVVADLVAEPHTVAALGAAMPEGTGRVLLARATGVDRTLDDALRSKGWAVERVPTYRIVPQSLPAPVRDGLRDGEFDVVTFASAGSVRSFRRSFGEALPRRTRVVCIGPVAARAARAAGMRVARVAEPHTIAALAAAVEQVATTGRAPSR